MSFNFNSDSRIGTGINPQFKKSPNPNPSFDRIADEIFHYQLDDALYFKDGSDNLILQENPEERGLSQSNSVLENATIGNKECGRIVKRYNKEKQDSRVAFRTKSKLEIMDDGFKWRKYGKKRVKSSPNPRNYFKCSNGECSVKKTVERDGNDPSYVITIYEGVHNHESPTCVLYCNPQSLSL